jgi:hypothetical protein
MTDGVLLPVLIQGIRTKVDGSISLTVETQELSPSKVGEVFSLRKKIAMMYLSPKDVVTQKEMDQVNAINADIPGGKTPSKRMHNVLFILWKQDPEGYKDFNLYYLNKMEKFIEELKQNIKD